MEVTAIVFALMENTIDQGKRRGADLEDRAGDTGQGGRGEQKGRGEGKRRGEAEVRGREGGRGWSSTTGWGPRTSQGLSPASSSPALTSFSLPGANGFPCCGKESVDTAESQ